MKHLKRIVPLLAVILLASCSSPDALKEMIVYTNPDLSPHYFNNNDLYSDEYLSFKSKILSFSSRLSESFKNNKYDGNENIVVSPLSIEMCLGLAIRSASNNTRQEMLDAIGVDYETFDRYYSVFYNDMSHINYNELEQKLNELTLTNSIWIDNEISLKQDCLNDLRDYYYCYSIGADFNNNLKATKEAMKQFIKEKTHGLIEPDVEVTENTLFVLLNTLYLKDLWNMEGLDLYETDEAFKFVNHDKSIKETKLLEGYYSSGKTIETESFSASKAMSLSGMKIYFIKPEGDNSIEDVFNASTIDYVINANNYTYRDDELMEEYYTRVLFPSFKADSEVDLKDMFIKDFKVDDIFTDSADMSSISKDRVFCTDFKHIAKLEVNKKGIEGAAVTYMAYAGEAGPGPYKEVYNDFVVDEEFGYVLVYKDAILFSGIISKI